MSPVTSHVLDTALGRPAAGVMIGLQRAAEGSGGTAWDTIGEARTNADGRVPDLLPPGNYLAQGASLGLSLPLHSMQSSCTTVRPSARFVLQGCHICSR